MPSIEGAPKINTDTLVRLQVPYFGNFDFPVADCPRARGRAGLHGRVRRASARGTRLALDALIASDDFKERLAREDTATCLDKVVRRFSIEPEAPVVPPA